MGTKCFKWRFLPFGSLSKPPDDVTNMRKTRSARSVLGVTVKKSRASEPCSHRWHLVVGQTPSSTVTRCCGKEPHRSGAVGWWLCTAASLYVTWFNAKSEIANANVSRPCVCGHPYPVALRRRVAAWEESQSSTFIKTQYSYSTRDHWKRRPRLASGPR